MGKINICLKVSFIFFNALFVLIGCLLVFGAVRISGVTEQFSSVGTPRIEWFWIFAIGVLGISSLGIYAGCSEKPLVLKVFAGFMVAGIIVMIIFGIYVAVTRNTIKDLFTTRSDTSNTLMQNEGFRNMLRDLQGTVKCCGLSDADDWGPIIPETCACDRYSYGICIPRSQVGFMTTFKDGHCLILSLWPSEATVVVILGVTKIIRGKSKPTKPILILTHCFCLQSTTGPAMIHLETCGAYIFDFVDIFMKVAMGFCFGFAVTALLGLLVTLLMLHQIKQHDGEGPGMSMKNY
ncbi:uncharacterized protein [Eucyclogobius newberryi]|uniref:uncharacterized protein n=1 Tax=Eucyclogobius newberryi TaxID=166745 RepID=UPI003B5A9CDD